MEPSEQYLDDPDLLADRLLRSLHKNVDGHLASSKKSHYESILDEHNVAVLYVYTADDDSYTMHQHYVYSFDPRSYREWLALVIAECYALEEANNKGFYGVYGWLTSHLRITPLRTGDLFIKIDKEGAKGVRLAFGPREDKLETHPKAKAAQRRKRSNRV